MEKYVATLRVEVEEQLHLIENRNVEILEKARLAIDLLETSFIKLKGFIVDYEFKDEHEEIYFFKELKPKLFSPLIYYRKVYEIEVHRPAGSVGKQIDYLKGKLEGINVFFYKNLDMFCYYRSGSCHMDNYYFMRGTPDVTMSVESFYFERDPKFSTICDFKVAKLLANERLLDYLNKAINNLENNDPGSPAMNIAKTKHTWTARKNELIEMIYAWDTDGCFDNGTCSLAQITSYIEDVFNVDLGNVPRNFFDMKIRNTPTPFLDRLRMKLLERMDRL